jgi:hypothetical protein
MVPVPHNNGTVVPFGTASLVPSILPPLDRGGWTVPKIANHCKTCTNDIDFCIEIISSENMMNFT